MADAAVIDMADVRLSEAHVALRLRRLFRKIEDAARELSVCEEQFRLVRTMQAATRINNVECRLNRLRDEAEAEIEAWRSTRHP